MEKKARAAYERNYFNQEVVKMRFENDFYEDTLTALQKAKYEKESGLLESGTVESEYAKLQAELEFSLTQRFSEEYFNQAYSKEDTFNEEVQYLGKQILKNQNQEEYWKNREDIYNQLVTKQNETAIEVEKEEKELNQVPESFRDTSDYRKRSKKLEALKQAWFEGDDKLKQMKVELDNRTVGQVINFDTFVDNAYAQLKKDFKTLARDMDQDYIKDRAFKQVYFDTLKRYKTLASEGTSNSEVYKENWNKIKKAYHLTDEDGSKLTHLLNQIKNRVLETETENQIMLCLYGKQGDGKTVFAQALASAVSGTPVSKVVNMGMDSLLDKFQNPFIYAKPLLVLNEFGKSNKENADALKMFVDGGYQEVEEKFKTKKSVKIISSAILTTNTNPEQLYSREGESRRILTINWPDQGSKESKTDWELQQDDLVEIFKAMYETVSNDTLKEVFETTSRTITVEKARKESEENWFEFIAGLEQNIVEKLANRYWSKPQVVKMADFKSGFAKDKVLTEFFDKKKLESNGLTQYKLKPEVYQKYLETLTSNEASLVGQEIKIPAAKSLKEDSFEDFIGKLEY